MHINGKSETPAQGLEKAHIYYPVLDRVARGPGLTDYVNVPG